MLAFLLFLVIIYVAAGIVGAVVHGLLWLLIVAIVLFVATGILSIFFRGRTVGKNKARR